ncbi:MAG: diacylglycerol kinase family lipid kinase [Oscillospiraceae bacterium]
MFIINPTAGKVPFADALVSNIHRFFKQNGGIHNVFLTNGRGEAQSIARQQAQIGDEMVAFACGGEGTSFEVLNGIFGYPNVVLGVMPYGTANDFLKYFNDDKAFLSLKEQIGGTAIPIDIIKAGEMYALNQCSCGMDATAAQNTEKFKKFATGIVAYKMAIVYTFFSKLGYDMSIKVDGRLIDDRTFLFAVCANSPYYGGGYKSAPTANPTDGELDFCTIRTMSRLKAIGMLKNYMRGTHIDKEYCKYGRCSVMEIEAQSEMPVNLDGEIFFRRKIKFEIVRRGVRFLVPSVVASKFSEKEMSKVGATLNPGYAMY